MNSDRARQLLGEERARIEQALASLNRGSPQTRVDRDEPGDEGSETLYQNEFDADRAADLALQLEALEAAEARLSAGTYGLSVESGEPIPDERLEALPTAERTLDEQQVRDRA